MNRDDEITFSEHREGSPSEVRRFRRKTTLPQTGNSDFPAQRIKSIEYNLARELSFDGNTPINTALIDRDNLAF